MGTEKVAIVITITPLGVLFGAGKSTDNFDCRVKVEVTYKRGPCRQNFDTQAGWQSPRTRHHPAVRRCPPPVHYGAGRSRPLEQPIAHGVALPVIDRFESVNIEIHRRESLAVVGGMDERPLDAIPEQAAIGWAGQVIVVGQMFEASHGLDARADIVGSGDERGDAPEPVDERPDVEFRVETLALFSALDDHGGKRLSGLERRRDPCL